MALPRTQIPTFRTRKQFCGSRMENFETCSDEAFIVNVTKISLEAPLKHGKTLEAALRDFRKDDAEKAYFTAIDTVFSRLATLNAPTLWINRCEGCYSYAL